MTLLEQFLVIFGFYFLLYEQVPFSGETWTKKYVAKLI